MTPLTAAQALADATAALVQDNDVADVLARLLRDCAEVLSAEAVGLLVLTGDGDLELLSSTSHRLDELELYQIQQDSGPYVEAIRTGATTSCVGIDLIAQRWPEVGAAIVAAGYQGARAYPLRWHGSTLGAMNVFHADAEPVGADDALLGQSFADIATVVIVQSVDLTIEQVTARVYRALEARTAVERAKGVLAFSHELDMAQAYELLVRMAAENQSTLSATANQVIAQAQRRIDG
jgi:hypothetical protein